MGAKVQAPSCIAASMLHYLARLSFTSFVGRALHFSRLPLASFAGCALALLASSVHYARGPAVDGVLGTHLFSGFALFAILGLWIDWARLYPVSRRTVVVSAAAFVATLLLAFVGVVLNGVGFVALAHIGAAVAIPVGARVFWWLAARARSAWVVVSGEVRHEDHGRLVLVSPTGDVISLDRDADELSRCRAFHVSVGSSLAVLARLDTEMASEPYRREARLAAGRLLCAAPDPSALRRRFYKRARGWALYAWLLVPVALFAAAAFTLDVAPCGVPPEIHAQ